MANTTLVFGALLILLGLVGYAGDPAAANASKQVAVDDVADADATERPKRSVTALIPAFVGGLLVLCGALAFKETRRKHVMHVAVLVGLLGLLASGGRGAMGLAKLASSDPDVNRRSLAFVCAMAVLCGVYVALCVRSFIQARKRRTQEVAA